MRFFLGVARAPKTNDERVVVTTKAAGFSNIIAHFYVHPLRLSKVELCRIVPAFLHKSRASYRRPYLADMSERTGNSRNHMSTDDFAKQERALKARADKFRASAAAKGLDHQVVDVFSDGTRMTGTVWKLANTPRATKLPTIVLAHGWGGKRDHLDFSYASAFAKAGFLALTFDYRGWGDSDGVLVATERQPTPDADGCVTVKARVVRKVIDPERQLRDLDSALNFIQDHPNCDVSNIGLWGSSFGGGHVLAVAAKDPRVKAVVAQIGSINTHVNWVNRHPEYKGVKAIRELATDFAHGRSAPWTIARPIGLDGMPHLPKVVFEQTRNTIDSLDSISCPTMILAAEKEELFPNDKNSGLVYERLKWRVPADLSYLPGGHYDAYGQPAYGVGLEQATYWFKLYLTDSPIPKPKSKL